MGSFTPCQWTTGGSIALGTYTVTTTSATTSDIYAAPVVGRKKTPLEWLDAEVEGTCALARAA